MHNRAAVASLVVLVIIALFVTLAPMLSQFTYFDTDWGMMSSAPDMSPATISVPIHPDVICWCACRLVANISLIISIAARAGGSDRRDALWLASSYLGGKSRLGDDASRKS